MNTDDKTFVSNTKFQVIVIIAIAFLARLLISAVDFHFAIDINDFKIWSRMLVDNGLSNFYTSDAFTDYPPGYMYILYILGAIQSFFNLNFDSYFFTLLVKSPAIICDVATSVLILTVARNHCKPRLALLLALAYALNPAIILDSTVWGQVDSVYTLVLLGSIHFLTLKHFNKGYLLFAIAILIKPQALILSPIYLYSAYNILVEEKFAPDAFLKVFKLAVACFALLFIGILPFTDKFNFTPVIDQYKATLSSYAFCSVNAFNFHALVGGNWKPITDTFLTFKIDTWGLIFIDLIVILSVYLLDRNKSKSNLFFVAALLNTLTFVFAVKMHERYLFPTLAFLLFAYIYNKNKHIFALYCVFSATFFVNCLDVLVMSQNNFSLEILEPHLFIVSLINVLFAIFMIVLGFIAYKENGNDEYLERVENVEKPTIIEERFELVGFTKRDFILCGLLMFVYGCVAFYNLGDTKSPQTFWNPREGDTAIVEFENVVDIDNFEYMLGVRHIQRFSLSSSIDGENWTEPREDVGETVFAWKVVPYVEKAKFIKITAVSDELYVQELAFKFGGNLLPIANYSTSAAPLFDEQNLVPIASNFRNSMYFDEIYHARTAYEFINKLSVYEWTHPPLGKVIISIGVEMFGMTPFGWRFMGTLFGVLMIIPMFAFGKKIFASTGLAFLAAFLFAFDFMHFAQTRIATIDTYITFFIICMFYYMFIYINRNFESEKISKSLIPLALSGVFMGLGVASKWPGVYAGLGLAAIFFYNLYGKYTRKATAKQIMQIISTCVVFFIAVPIAIYCLSYIPFLQSPNQNGVSTIIKNQVDMFNYHSKLVSPHPYSSEFWSWPLDIRPIYYFAADVGNGLKQGISSFGNPAVWWGGIVAFVYCAYRAVGRRDKIAAFLIVSFLAQYLPWVFVSRTTYIYHYFPCIPFLVLIIVYFLKKVVLPINPKLVYGYAAIVFILFVMFYPVLSGMSISPEFVKFLKWLPTWQLI